MSDNIVTHDGPATTHPEQVAEIDPMRRAVVMTDTGDTLTYGELVASANQIARALLRFGVSAGDTIALLVANGPALFSLVWAAKNSGLRYVMVSTRLNQADTEYIVRDSNARLVITTQEFAPRMKSLADSPADVPVLVADGSYGAMPNLASLARSEPQGALPERRRGSSMLYSSGTTGRPKGVQALLHDVPPEVPPARHEGLIRAFGIGASTRFITAAPLYHAGPLRIAMAVQRAGGTVLSARHFDPEALLAAISSHGATHGFFVPTMFRTMLDLPQDARQQYKISSMGHAIHGAAPCPIEVKRMMIDWWGPVIDELYGGTESVGQTYITAREWLEHPGSVGRASGSVEVKIVDENGERLPPGLPGLVRLRNPQRFAYHGAAVRQDGEAAYDDEGFATLGDIGYLDAEGYLYLTGRSSNVIISGGVNIYPQEAENVLLTHPAIADVVIFGVPDRDLGEVAKALVVLKPGHSRSKATEAEIMEFCSNRLSQYKCPRLVEFQTHISRNEMGKFIKRYLQ